MSNDKVYDEIVELLKTLPPEKVKEARDFVESLKQKSFKANAEGSFRQFCGILSNEDAEAMIKAIEDGCERIDYSEW